MIIDIYLQRISIFGKEKGMPTFADIPEHD
jgi:hypothetical protein